MSIILESCLEIIRLCLGNRAGAGRLRAIPDSNPFHLGQKQRVGLFFDEVMEKAVGDFSGVAESSAFAVHAFLRCRGGQYNIAAKPGKERLIKGK